jgi:hypothetical protein
VRFFERPSFVRVTSPNTKEEIQMYYWCDYIGMNSYGSNRSFLFYEHTVSFGLLECTACSHSEVSAEAEDALLAVTLQAVQPQTGVKWLAY